jgi:hypothetical protein
MKRQGFTGQKDICPSLHSAYQIDTSECVINIVEFLKEKTTENSSSFWRGCLMGELRNLSFFNLNEVILAFNSNNQDRFSFNQNI